MERRSAGLWRFSTEATEARLAEEATEARLMGEATEARLSGEATEASEVLRHSCISDRGTTNV